MKRKIPKIGYKYDNSWECNSLYIVIKNVKNEDNNDSKLYIDREYDLVSNIHTRNRANVALKRIKKIVETYYDINTEDNSYAYVDFWGGYLSWDESIYTTMNGIRLIYKEAKKSPLYVMKKLCRLIENSELAKEVV